MCASNPNTQCDNREGSFECVCAPGFFLNKDAACERKSHTTTSTNNCIIGTYILCSVKNELPPQVNVILPSVSFYITLNFSATNLAPKMVSCTVIVAINEY